MKPLYDPNRQNERPPVAVCEPNLRSHIPALDAIRGIAVLMVLVYHFNLEPADFPSPLARWTMKVFGQGSFGVDLFFVLSGFLITGILFDDKQSSHYFRNFYARRTLRIFPLYHGVLFVAFVLLPIVRPWGITVDAGVAQYQAWLWLYGTNILQSWKGDWLLGDFNHFWSLAIEEHFYLLWPLVIYSCRRRTILWICGVLIVLALACRVGLAMLGGNEVAIYALTPCRVDALAAGAWLAIVARDAGGVRRLVPGARISLLMSCGLLAWLYWLNARTAGTEDRPLLLQLRPSDCRLVFQFTLNAWFFASVLILAITTSPTSLPGRFWNSTCLRFFGKYSYGLYVYQVLLIPFFHSCFDGLNAPLSAGSPFAGRMLFTAEAALGTVAVALMSWHLYEKHFLKLKRFFAYEKDSHVAPPQLASPAQGAT